MRALDRLTSSAGSRKSHRACIAALTARVPPYVQGFVDGARRFEPRIWDRDPGSAGAHGTELSEFLAEALGPSPACPSSAESTTPPLTGVCGGIALGPSGHSNVEALAAPPPIPERTGPEMALAAKRRSGY